MMQYTEIQKEELAISQLDVALTMYFDDKEYPSVITLAGAAEEILGKMAYANGKSNTLKNKVTNLLQMHKDIFGEDAEEKAFVNIRNRARNETLSFWCCSRIGL